MLKVTLSTRLATTRSFAAAKPMRFKTQRRSFNVLSQKTTTKTPFSLKLASTSMYQRWYNIDERVTHAYEHNHKPSSFIKDVKRGPPYTDVAKLEGEFNDLVAAHVKPETTGDKFAYQLVTMVKPFNHLFFRDKYTHHAVVLETVAAVPGMVAGMQRHFKSLRNMQRDHGWIHQLLEEAENERMHLLTWMQLCQPTFIERLLVVAAQCVYTPFYAIMYAFAPAIAHKFVGYLEEEACLQYTLMLKAIDDGKIENVPAPDIAKEYWNLKPEARLRDVVLVIRADEAMHRDVNHRFADRAKHGMY